MEIKTEKTHVITLTSSELNALRVFLEDAIQGGINQFWGESLEVIREMHDSFVDADRGGYQ